jgi:hypothetical protein
MHARALSQVLQESLVEEARGEAAVFVDVVGIPALMGVLPVRAQSRIGGVRRPCEGRCRRGVRWGARGRSSPSPPESPASTAPCVAACSRTRRPPEPSGRQWIAYVVDGGRHPVDEAGLPCRAGRRRRGRGSGWAPPRYRARQARHCREVRRAVARRTVPPPHRLTS